METARLILVSFRKAERRFDCTVLVRVQPFDRRLIETVSRIVRKFNKKTSR